MMTGSISSSSRNAQGVANDIILSELKCLLAISVQQSAISKKHLKKSADCLLTASEILMLFL
jgi:hypothetical protein